MYEAKRIIQEKTDQKPNLKLNVQIFEFHKSGWLKNCGSVIEVLSVCKFSRRSNQISDTVTSALFLRSIYLTRHETRTGRQVHR